jgi:hypothetical protein
MSTVASISEIDPDDENKSPKWSGNNINKQTKRRINFRIN